MRIQIQPLLASHWEAIKDIYEKGLALGNASFQTSAPPGWEHWDMAHVKHSRFIAKTGERIVGWVALSPTSTRACYEGVCELSIYVDPGYHNQGIGNLLMESVITSSEANGTWSLYSSTFPENLASIALQKKFGFREIGYREKIARLNGVWRNTLLLERRSKVVG